MKIARQLLLQLSTAACAGAASLRGEGVEEVGDWIEHLPPEDFYVEVDRRRVLEEYAKIAGDYHDERLDRDPEGRRGGEDEEGYGDEETTDEVSDEWPDRDIIGGVVEDEGAYDEWHENFDDYDEDVPTIKEYAPDPDSVTFVGTDLRGEDVPTHKEHAPDPDSVTFVGTDLRGEDVDQFNRREASCDGNKSEFKIVLTTDFYAYETKWKLLRRNGSGNDVIAEGPPDGENYADETAYSGRWCLPVGAYKFRVIDNGRDGICSDNANLGCGSLRTFLDGKNSGRMINDKSNWRIKDFPFLVGIGSRIDATKRPTKRPTPRPTPATRRPTQRPTPATRRPTPRPTETNPNEDTPWCQKVRSAMRTRRPRGTCSLPNGQPGHQVKVTTRVDKYGKETSWKITSKSRNVVRMQMGPVVEPYQEKVVEDCLPAGEYNLEFRDIDGICCRHGEGFFNLTVNGEELLNGGRFTKSIDHDFQLGFDWISTMDDRDCEWWWAHHHRRQDWHTRCDYPEHYCNKPYRHLKWSPALKADAMDYAVRLLDTCEENGIEHDATDQGENLAKNRGGADSWGALYPADKVTKRFVDNEEFWGWNRNAHLTQAIWYPTRYIGCAESEKNMGNGRMCRFQVCRYAKAGNCLMAKYDSATGNNWMTPMMMDDSPCGPMCASRDGCYH